MFAAPPPAEPNSARAVPERATQVPLQTAPRDPVDAKSDAEPMRLPDIQPRLAEISRKLLDNLKAPPEDQNLDVPRKTDKNVLSAFEEVSSPPQIFNTAYSFSLWLSGLKGLAEADKALQAEVLLKARPLLSKGKVLAVAEKGILTLMAADNMEILPVTIALAELAPTAQAATLAANLEKARAQDNIEGGRYFRLVEALNHLKALSEETPQAKKPELAGSQDMPLNPLTEPQAYVARMLRDAMRSKDPLDTLARLRRTTDEAKKLLNPHERFAFLGQLRSQAELLSSQFVPGLLEKAQESASKNDKSNVEKWINAALEFCEYAPKLKPMVVKSYEKARNTLSLISLLGQADEKTGQPPKPEQP